MTAMAPTGATMHVFALAFDDGTAYVGYADAPAVQVMASRRMWPRDPDPKVLILDVANGEQIVERTLRWIHAAAAAKITLRRSPYPDNPYLPPGYARIEERADKTVPAKHDEECWPSFAHAPTLPGGIQDGPPRIPYPSSNATTRTGRRHLQMTLAVLPRQETTSAEERPRDDPAPLEGASERRTGPTDAGTGRTWSVFAIVCDGPSGHPTAMLRQTDRGWARIAATMRSDPTTDTVALKVMDAIAAAGPETRAYAIVLEEGLDRNVARRRVGQWSGAAEAAEAAGCRIAHATTKALKPTQRMAWPSLDDLEARGHRIEGLPERRPPAPKRAPDRTGAKPLRNAAEAVSTAATVIRHIQTALAKTDRNLALPAVAGARTLLAMTGKGTRALQREQAELAITLVEAAPGGARLMAAVRTLRDECDAIDHLLGLQATGTPRPERRPQPAPNELRRRPR